jgi:hypothetical protein
MNEESETWFFCWTVLRLREFMFQMSFTHKNTFKHQASTSGASARGKKGKEESSEKSQGGADGAKGTNEVKKPIGGADEVWREDLETSRDLSRGEKDRKKQT